MKVYIDLILKLFFALSLLPFLLAEKFQEKFEVRLDPHVVDSLFSQPKTAGKIRNRAIDEASGMVASRLHPNLLYTHNDSGGDPYIYLLDTSGRDRGMITLKGVKNRDWEDIAIGPGPKGGKPYIYVGEIGDNGGNYDYISLLRFREPETLKDETEISPEIIHLTYPDGARDAETLMVDPWNGDVFVLSKRDSSNTLYMVEADKLLPNADPIPLKKIMKLPITMSVAGDISQDGTQILIKNYWVVYYWTREPGESLPEALSRDPILLPYKPEPQGEAIAFFPNGKGYFTLSEKKLRVEPVLYKYHKLPN